MPKLSCLLLVTLLAACGMKGNLYEAPPPPVAAPAPTDADEEKGERKTIPSDPDPALSR
jgi:predicted small lipoprotein YifL